MGGPGIAIAARELGKKYRINGWAGQYRNLTLRDEIAGSLEAPFRSTEKLMNVTIVYA